MTLIQASGLRPRRFFCAKKQNVSLCFVYFDNMYNLLAKTDIFLAQVDRIDGKKNIIIKITKNMGRGTAQFFVIFLREGA